MHTKPSITIGLLSGAILGAALLGVHLLLLHVVRQQEIGINLLLSGLLLLLTLPLGGMWLYSLIELVTLRYAVDRNALTISTWFRTYTIPHGAIRAIVPAADLGGEQTFDRVGWPGFVRGAVRRGSQPPLFVLGTEPLDRQWVVLTDSAHYAISPRDPEAFLHSWERHKELGPLESLSQGSEARAVAAWPVWRDRVFWLGLLAAFVANFALVAYAIGRYDQLPAIVPMHWNSMGQIDRLAPKAWVFSIPGIGAVILGVNLLLGMVLSFREQFGARLLAWASASAQAGLWFAAWQILAP